MAVAVSRANHRDVSKRSEAARITHGAITCVRRIGSAGFDVIQLKLERVMLRDSKPFSPYARELTEAEDMFLREIEKEELPVWRPGQHH